MQRRPARPIERRRLANLPEQTAPFDDHAVNVTCAEKLRHPARLVQRILVDARNDLFRAAPVTRRHAVLQITGNRLQAEELMARDRKTTSVTILFAAETEARVEIREVVDQFVERIPAVLQRSADGKTVLLLEKEPILLVGHSNLSACRFR